ncbi:hypothetical protein V1527DRAFT_474576 [Lipomyces starkeyi]
MDSAKVFVDNIHTILSAIPSHVIQQVMSPAAPDVSGRFNANGLGTPLTVGAMVKFDGKNYRQWAMYMEALFMHKGTWHCWS